jgi:hypothetical protein
MKNIFNGNTSANHATNYMTFGGNSGDAMPAGIACGRYGGLIILSRFSTLSASPSNLIEPGIIMSDSTLSADHWYSYFNYLGTLTVNSDEKLKHSIKLYNKSVLDKFKNLKIYTYAYKLPDNNINLNNRDNFNDYYRK